MDRNLVAIVALLLLFATANADVAVTDVNVSYNNNGSGFVGSSDVNINFTVRDNNASCVMARTTFDANIFYATTKGAQTTAIVADLNLGDVNRSSGSCRKAIAAACSTAPTQCSYVWTSAAVNAINDGNLFVDVNVTVWAGPGTAIGMLYDFNMDTNASFYIDNKVPSCSFEKRAGNAYVWIVANEDNAFAVGSTTTLFSRVDDENAVATSLARVTNQTGEFFLSSGRHNYYCYATDSAGNVGSTTEKLKFEYPGGISVAVSGRGVAVTQPVAGLVANIPTTIAGFPTLLVLSVGIIVVILLAGGKKRKGSKRRKRR